MAAKKLIVFVLLVAYARVASCCLDNDDCTNSFVYQRVCCKGPGDYSCHSNCVGRSCVFHSDCGGAEEYCCDDVCQKGDCILAGWLIAVITLSVIGVVGALVGVVLCFFCSYRRRYPGLIVNEVTAQPNTTTSVVNTGYSVQGNTYPIVQPMAPCYGQPPPTYYPKQP